MHRFSIIRLVFPLLGYFWASQDDPGPIKYFQTPTIAFNWEELDSDTLYFRDSSAAEEFYQVRTSESIPLFYAQDISTEVCFDNKCRPLHVTVYWNITGRYLGFMLPVDDFFSRRDHDPFTPDDYIQLHALLADPFLPLGGVSFEALIRPPAINTEAVDGISGATSKNISSYVVEGAAYTTYTLWNAIHGPVQSRISDLTESQLTQPLLTLLLKSPSSEDKIWGLKKINKIWQLDLKVEKEILDIVSSEDFFVAYTAINELHAEHLRSESLQEGLISKYQEINPNLRKPILDKLHEAPNISPVVIRQTRDLLEKLNGMLLGGVLELYEKRGVDDLETLQVVTKLLKSRNAFIANKAYQFLVKLAVRDDIVSEAIKVYEANK